VLLRNNIHLTLCAADRVDETLALRQSLSRSSFCAEADGMSTLSSIPKSLSKCITRAICTAGLPFQRRSQTGG
jgi:hypothetical protein